MTQRTTAPDSIDALLANRLRRVARMVVGCHDYAAEFDPPNFDATGRATVALAIWEAMTGLEDGQEAITYARRVAGQGIDHA